MTAIDPLTGSASSAVSQSFCLRGCLVAIVTPMHEDGSLDFEGLERLIDWHVQSGTAGIVIVGTTGESPTVSVEEHCELIARAVEFARGRIPIIAGTGANSTAEALELSDFAKRAGAAAHLSVVPYYNKPTQEGLYRHFRTIAEKVDLPLILYNVPSRTVADLSLETTLRLAQIPNIVGLKDATGDLARGGELLRRLRREVRPSKHFLVYSGNDDTAVALCALGSDGVISVTANVAPREMAQLFAAALEGRWEEARALNDRLMPLHLKLFVEANPIPVKWALARLGRIGPTVRLPLTPLSPQFEPVLEQALKEAELV
ncbi:MAG: 4-hydroxy-tetrahydrodipicolinate synthase [Casimicrobiaceae bacterium]|nr:4-hydroxy-tetrahydrodipicolinate synthase [Casimicrobiaceae bacterium]MDW8312016.1 4-hydroxy-tetrahydrodipicolinate synthase [Burkholderiales bacterium]